LTPLAAVPGETISINAVKSNVPGYAGRSVI
jgi:hypothetical protein